MRFKRIQRKKCNPALAAIVCLIVCAGIIFFVNLEPRKMAQDFIRIPSNKGVELRPDYQNLLKGAMHRCAADPPTRINTDLVIQWANLTEVAPNSVRLDLIAGQNFTAKDTFVEIKYQLRSFFKHGMLGGLKPFIRDVHVVHADGHPPRHLREGKVNSIVGGHHLKFQPHSAMWRDTSNLPTANRNAIANSVHRIPGLADWFVFCEDDVFLANDFDLGHLYDYEQNMTRVRLTSSPTREANNGYTGAMHRSTELLREMFGERERHQEAYTCVLANRCVLDEAERQWPAEYAATEANRLQQRTDLQFQTWSQNMLIDAGIGIKASTTGSLEFHAAGLQCDSLDGPRSLEMLEKTKEFLQEAESTERMFVQLQGPGISDEFASQTNHFSGCRFGDMKQTISDWYQKQWFHPSIFEVVMRRKFKTSPGKRKFVAGVVSANKRSDRLAKFTKSWQSAWPELEVFVQQSFLNHQDLRGLGVFASQLLIMEEMLMRDPGSFDYVLIFEDDALPFDDVRWPGDLDQQLDKMERGSGDVLFLGLHHIHSENCKKPRFDDISSQLPNGIFAVNYAWGAYAYVIRGDFLPIIAQYFRDGIRAKNNTANAPDVEVWNSMQSSFGGAFVSVPLLVDHDAGYSSTWGKDRNDIQEFQGHRDWWNYHDKKIWC